MLFINNFFFFEHSDNWKGLHATFCSLYCLFQERMLFLNLVNHTTALFSSLQLVRRIFIDVFRPMSSKIGWMISFLSFQDLSILIQSWILKELPCLFLSRVLAITLPLNVSSQRQLCSFFHPTIYCLFE